MEDIRREFKKATRRQRDEVQTFLKKFVDGNVRTCTNGVDTTDQFIASVRDEIRSLNHTIAQCEAAGW